MTDIQSMPREELYKLVWSEPMIKLSARLNLSDKGLAKKCQRHNIPRPPLGYWAKLQNGHKVRQPPLPSNNDPELDKVMFRPKSESISNNYEASKAHLSEEQFAKALAFVIPDRVSRYHPVIAACRKSHKERNNGDSIDKYGRIIFPRMTANPGLKVTPETFDRACLLLQGLITLFGKIGWSFVEIYRTSSDAASPWGFKHGNEILQFEIKEVVTKILQSELKQNRKIISPKKQLPEPDFSFRNYFYPYYKSTDKLELGIEMYSPGFQVRWQDKDSQLIEHQLGAIAQSFSRSFEHRRVQTIEREKWQREYEIEKAENSERLRLKKVEEKRREQLFFLADTYDKASKIKRLITAIEEQASDDKPLEEWLSWAKGVLRELDPLMQPNAILQSYEAAGDKEKSY